MTQVSLSLNGAELLADLSGALFWPARGWLVAADLHLEKGSAFAARGTHLPPYDTAATLGALEQLCRRLRPARVVCLGDSFHDGGAAERMDARDARRLAELAAGHDWIWIAGNHDPLPPGGWGRVMAELVEGPLVFRHAAEPGAVGEVSGHYHPKASVKTRLRRITGRCFVADGHRLILPAFGAYAGGLNVLDPAISCLLQPGFSTWMLGDSKLHPFPATHLSGDWQSAAFG